MGCVKHNDRSTCQMQREITLLHLGIAKSFMLTIGLTMYGIGDVVHVNSYQSKGFGIDLHDLARFACSLLRLVIQNSEVFIRCFVKEHLRKWRNVLLPMYMCEVPAFHYTMTSFCKLCRSTALIRLW